MHIQALLRQAKGEFHQGLVIVTGNMHSQAYMPLARNDGCVVWGRCHCEPCIGNVGSFSGGASGSASAQPSSEPTASAVVNLGVVGRGSKRINLQPIAAAAPAGASVAGGSPTNPIDCGNCVYRGSPCGLPYSLSCTLHDCSFPALLKSAGAALHQGSPTSTVADIHFMCHFLGFKLRPHAVLR